MSKDNGILLIFCHTCIFVQLHRQSQNREFPCNTPHKTTAYTIFNSCFRYLATGDSHQTIAFSFRGRQSTVSNIVIEVCQELWNVLQPLYLPTPTEEMWTQAVTGFRERWGFLNCLGSIDGKHVKLKCPVSSGSNYFCYKNLCSIVLLAVVDPYYKFIVVDTDSYGQHSDSGIFKNPALYQEYTDGKTILPPKPLPGTNIPIPHVLIGDEGFALQTYLTLRLPD